MDKIKMICINDLIDAEDIWYKVGDFYYYDGMPVFRVFNLFYKDNGAATFRSLSLSREGLYNHFMPYNDWLALQREEQIKSVLDD